MYKCVEGMQHPEREKVLGMGRLYNQKHVLCSLKFLNILCDIIGCVGSIHIIEFSCNRIFYYIAISIDDIFDQYIYV